MYLSLNWVKKYLKLPRKTNKELGLDLTMSTVEVDSILNIKDSLEGILVGKIIEIEQHPKADKLKVCKVNIGRETEQIVCGGSNLYKGMLVAVAKVGSMVKWHGKGDYIKLEKIIIRGVESNGMIVSSSEIGLDNLFIQKIENEILDLSNLRITLDEETDLEVIRNIYKYFYPYL